MTYEVPTRQPRGWTDAGPAHVPVWEAVKRGWVAVAVPVVVLLSAAAFIALSLPPTYSAEARLTVGRLDVDPAALANFASATQSLAASYSRAVPSNAVVNRVAKRLRMTPDEVRAGLSASPIPESPVIRVEGESRSSRTAIQLANAASTALVSYTSTLNRSSADSRRLFVQYKAAALALDRAQAKSARLRARLAPRRTEVAKAGADVESARLRARSLANAYEGSQQGLGSSKIVQVLTEASAAKSDRNSRLEIFGFVGLALGLLIGVALATARANQLARLSALE